MGYIIGGIAFLAAVLVVVLLFSRKQKDKPPRKKWVFDFEMCTSMRDLAECLRQMDAEGAILICATESESWYTLFFMRPINRGAGDG